jgi:hypothetical protein
MNLIEMRKALYLMVRGFLNFQFTIYNFQSNPKIPIFKLFIEKL